MRTGSILTILSFLPFLLLTQCQPATEKTAQVEATSSPSDASALPFPPAPSGSVAGLTMETSTYKKRVEPKHLAEGAPNILIILMDDVGPGTPST
jgi:hypothetical protein